MRRINTILIVRSVIAVLVAILAVVNFATGRVVLGVVFAALAVTNVVLTLTIRRRWAGMRRRYPGVAARRDRWQD